MWWSKGFSSLRFKENILSPRPANDKNMLICFSSPVNDCTEKMQPGMTFTIEPALTHGSEETVLLDDDWTLITEDGARAAQVEHTVLITENGAEILTK